MNTGVFIMIGLIIFGICMDNGLTNVAKALDNLLRAMLVEVDTEDEDDD